MRRAAPSGWGGALAVAAAAALACHGGVEPDVVVARLAAASAGAQGVHRAGAVKLDTLTRDALAVAPGTAFEVACPADARALSVSFAARGDAATVRFAVAAQGGDRSAEGWQPLLDESTAADGAWRDRHVPLPPRTARLRFETTATGAGARPEIWWGSPLLLGPAPAGAEPRPNVVLISLDTLSAAHLSSFDNVPGVSPRLDAFLEEGFSFRRAFAQYGNTLVSHASLFTGLYPLRHQLYPGHPPLPIDSLVSELAAHGYLTLGFTEGAFVSANFGFSAGFDAYDDGLIGLEKQMAGGAAETFGRAAAWLTERGRDTRFFLFLHTYEVHAPYLPRDAAALEVVERVTPGDRRLFSREFQTGRSFAHNSGRLLLSEPDLAHLHALHSGEIHTLDRVVGGFLDELAALGLADDTLVVVTSDHGDQFGEHGKVGHSESLHNRVLHVPLGFRWPGVVPRGSSDVPVQLVDVLPTVFDLAGLPLPEGRDGRSLVGFMHGDAPAPRPAFAEQRSARGECARLGLGRACRLDRFSAQSGRFKLVTSEVPPWEVLYDLEADPLETRDVADEHPEQVERLRAALARYRERAPARAPDGGGAVLDAQTVERLRALGYTE